jgi:hypothetical protein
VNKIGKQGIFWKIPETQKEDFPRKNRLFGEYSIPKSFFLFLTFERKGDQSTPPPPIGKKVKIHHLVEFQVIHFT